jgi:signal transduction histidine kinase/DNA-binding response OmpR family regulator
VIRIFAEKKWKMIKNRLGKSVYKLIILFLWGLFPLSAQKVYLYSEYTGFKYFKNYSYREYRSVPQTTMIDQNSQGIIYVANQWGILEFDGASWQVIQIPPMLVFSLAIDDEDMIYVGGRGHIGFLAPDSKGVLQYMSLVDQLNDNYRNFPLVWPTYCVRDKIYFSNRNFLFQWDKKENKMNVWKPRYAFDNIFSLGDKFFIYDDKFGLMQIINGSLNPVPEGKTFAGKEVEMMVPYDSDGKRILIGTQFDGFYLYDGTQFVRFHTKADDYLRRNQLSYGIRLGACPGEFALTTMLGGIVIIDSHGNLKYIFNKNTGLQDNHVTYIFEDSQGVLWLALSKGISRLEYSSPFEIYDERLNLPGEVLSIMKHHGDLYVGTTSGLYFLSSLPSRGFQLVSDISNMCFSLLSIKKSILVGTNRGIFLVQHGQHDTKQKVLETSCGVLYRSPLHNHRIWVGTMQGLVALRMNIKNNLFQFMEEKKIENTNADIRAIVEDPKGNLWLSTLQKGVIKVDFPTDIHHPVVTWYNTSHGLPSGGVSVFFAAGHVMFTTNKGIFRFDQANNKFIPDRTLGDRFASGDRNAYPIVADQDKNIWFNSFGYNVQAIAQPDGSFFINSIPFRRIPPAFGPVIYPDPDDDSVWFGSADGLIRYNPRIKKNYQHEFQAIIRKVEMINKKTSFFEGHQSNPTNKSKPSFLTLKYKHRNLHITVAAPFFEDESRTTYQCFLEGHDKDWSSWTSETHGDYPDLSPGFYTFRVRARNIYEHLSSEDVFQFKILPPWYRTWWAFLCYAIGFFLVIYLAVKWRSRKLEQEKKHLEQIINERTKEIGDKNQQLEKQTLQLKNQSEQLKEMDKVKSRFFANISHEFRTPLTLIMGPLEQILSDSKDKELKQKAGLMLRNSKRLLTLVNQLLELARFDSGKMTLQASLQNIVSFLKSIVASFESLAIQQKLELIFQAEAEDISLYFDSEKLERVIFNLLSNAIKFTPPEGKIMVTVNKNLTKETNFPDGSLDISVRDTGIGILESQLEHIFERFYQASGSYENQQKGSGIGLALTKELVVLHHGEIHVRCSTGKEGKTSGTEFIVRLPMGKEHLKHGEIVDTPIPETKTPPLSIYKDKEFYEFPGLAIDTIKKEEEAVEKVGSDESDAVAEEAKGIDIEIESEIQGKNIILVVEDSIDMRNYIKCSLEPLYQVIEAANGKEGIQKAREIIPDLIISDIMMPEANGYELLGVLKRDITTSHIPIILLTAKASEESVIQGLEIGADDYITKPFNTKILAARIKNLIDLRCQIQLERKRRMALQPTEISVSSMDETFYKELQNILEKNLTDPEFNVEQLCKKLYMGRTSLYRKILALTGEPPTQFIRSYRLQRAAQLLKAHFGNVTEVAFAVGFSNTAYFTKCFKEKFHQLPSTLHASETHGSMSQ